MPTKSTKSQTSAAKATTTSKAAKSTKAAKAAKPSTESLEAVRPLIKVRQVRDFTGKRVTKAELDAIAEVARWTGTSRNEQPLRFVAIRDKGTIQRIAEAGLPQTRGLPRAQAAIAIVSPDEPERELSRAFDHGRATERIMIAANLLGMGAGVSRVRADVRSNINELLGLPDNRSVRTIIAIGHPSPEALARKSPRGTARLPREQVIYENGWPTTSE